MPGEEDILEGGQEAEAAEVAEEQEQVESEVEAEEEPEKPRGDPAVPLRRARQDLKRLSNDLEIARQQNELLRLQLGQLHHASQQKPARKRDDLNPQIRQEVTPYIEEILEERLEEIRRDSQQSKQAYAQLVQQLEGDKAIRYLEKHVPDLDEWREAIVEELEELQPHTREAILSDERAMVRFVKAIKAEARKIPETRAARDVIKSRAKSESGMSSNRSAPKSESSDLSWDSPDFVSLLKKRGFNL